MKITKWTLTKRVVPLMNDERYEKLIANVPPVAMKKELLDMTVGEFIEASQPEFIQTFLKHRRAFKAFGMIRTYTEDMNRIASYMKRYDISGDDNERKAAAGVEMPTAHERMLCDLVKYFHLHSFAEAENIPMTEYLLMLKDNGSSALYQRNYNKIAYAKR